MFDNYDVNTQSGGLFDIHVVSINLLNASGEMAGLAYTGLKTNASTLLNPKTPEVATLFNERSQVTSNRDQTHKTGALLVEIKMCAKVADPIAFYMNLSRPAENRPFKGANLIGEAGEIKVAVVQVTDVDTRKKMMSNPSALVPISSKEIHNSPNLKTKILSFMDSVPSGFLINSKYGTIPVSANGSSREPFLDDMINQLPFTRCVDSTGELYYEIPLTAHFLIEEEQGGASISDLSYFFYTFVDPFEQWQELSRGRASNRARYRLSARQRQVSLGNIKIESVIKNGKLNSTSKVFKDASGKYWTGKVHRMRNGNYMKGATHGRTNPSDYLSSLDVTNPKIRDHRIFAAIQKYNFANLFLSDNSSNYKTKNPRLIKEKREDRSLADLKGVMPVLSDIQLSTDRLGQVKYMFSLNLLEAVKQGSSFPNIVDALKRTNPAAYSAIMKSATIERISLNKQRVGGTIEGADGFFKQSNANDDIQKTFQLAPQIVAYTDAKSNQDHSVTTTTVIPPSENSMDYERQTSGTIKELRNIKSNNSNEIRHFTGVDMTAAEGATYRYSVEMSIKDPVGDFIISAMTSIDNILGDGIATPDPNLNTYTIDIRTKPNFYDPYMRRFKQEFMSFYNSRYSTNNRSFILSAIQAYVTILFTFVNSKKFPYTPLEVTNYLTLICSPNTGSPEGIEIFTRLLRNTRSQLDTLVKYQARTKNRSKDNEEENASPNLGAASRARSLVFRKSFKKTLPKFVNGMGLDYLFLTLGGRGETRNSLTTVSREEILQRFSAEVNKFFTDDREQEISIRNQSGDILNPNDRLDNTKYSFLSPSNILLGGVTSGRNAYINTSCALTSQNVSLISEAMLKIIAVNKYRELGMRGKLVGFKTFEGTRELGYDLAFQAFAGDGVSVQIRDEDDVARSERLLDDGGDNTASTNFGSAMKVISNETFKDEGRDEDEGRGEEANSTTRDNTQPRESISSDLLPFIGALSKANSGGLLDPCNRLENFFLRDNSGGLAFIEQYVQAMCAFGSGNRGASKPPLNDAPIQTKALLLALNGSNRVRKSKLTDGIGDTLENSLDVLRNPMNYAFLWYNYKSLKQVQVFRGYRTEGGRSYVNEPIFTKMKLSDIKKIRDRDLVCRLADVEDKSACIDSNVNLKLPTFDDIFILTGASNTRGGNTDYAGRGTFSGPFNFIPGLLGSDYYDNIKSLLDYIDQKSKTTDPAQCGESGGMKTEYAYGEVADVYGDVMRHLGGYSNMAGTTRSSGGDSSVANTLDHKTIEKILAAGFGDMLPESMRKVSKLRSDSMGHSQEQKITTGGPTKGFNSSQLGIGPISTGNMGSGGSGGSGGGGGTY
tara:strand:- start:1632 stop:5654 length:4023 start_codon:yes stop_codon:yes gene_type:complete